MKISFISQHTWISMTMVLVSIFSGQSLASLSFYDSDTYHGPILIAQLGFHFIYILELGPKFPDVPFIFEGMAVLAEPEDGCQSIAPPPNATEINPFGKWIAVMKIGNCDLTVKARNAQHSGYHMALVNVERSYVRPEMTEFDRSSNNSDIEIYTVFANSHAIEDIKENATYDKKIVLSIINDEDDPLDCYDTFGVKENKTMLCVGTYTEKIIHIPEIWYLRNPDIRIGIHLFDLPIHIFAKMI